MINLTDEIIRLLDDIIDRYESDTDKDSDHESMISGLIRMKHMELFS